MADVGRLRWIMTADTHGFERGVGRVRRGLLSIGRMGAGMLGAGGLVGGMRAGLATADAIGKIADAVDVSTTELQGLRFAIQETGGTAEQMDRALAALSRRTGELATTHRGQLAEFLRKTDAGLFMTLKRAGNTTEAFMALAKAMQALPDQRSRAALAAAAFGRTPIGVLNLLGRGPAGIRESMGRIPPSGFLSEKMIRDAEETQDQILLMTEKATLAVSKAALSVISFVQDIRRELERPANAVSAAGQRASSFVTENFPWTLRLLRYRGMIGRLMD